MTKLGNPNRPDYILAYWCRECGQPARLLRPGKGTFVGVLHAPDCDFGYRIRSRHPKILVQPNML